MKPFVAVFALALAISAASCERASDLAFYEGQYAKGSLNVVTVARADTVLTVRPLFWRSTQVLIACGPDSFVVTRRPERSIVFVRTNDGSISGLRVQGLGDDGFYRRLPGGKTLPIADLFFADAAHAARELVTDSTASLEGLLGVARQLLRWPSKADRASAFARELARAFPGNDRVLSTWGDALMVLGNREEAGRVYEQAVALNPANDNASRALVRLGRLTPAAPKDPLKISFTLQELFSPPTSEELAEVWDDWNSRDLEPAEWREIERSEMRIAEMESIVRIMAHKVGGDLHYGAIIVPHAAGAAPRPVMIEAKGVSWDYRPLDLEHDLRLPDILGAHRQDLIYVIPSFRGERMVLGQRSYLSEGDRTNAWDGATDDALALLELALMTTPQADSTRIGIFGQSRGGSVAFLAAIRDTRIRAVVSWCGPVDWFTHMGSDGWSLEEMVQEGVRLNAVPPEPGGQFIERYLRRPSADQRTLRFARHRMVASSPLYFLKHLPLVRCSYGREDTMVPVVNAESLVLAFRGNPDQQCRIVEGAGHDLEWAEKQIAQTFLVRTLLSNKAR